MSKKTFFQRTKSIIKKLNLQPYSSYEDVVDYMEREFRYKQMGDEESISYSKRTFQRDINEIHEVWGIHITYDAKRKGYYINHDTSFAMNNQRLFEIFELMSALDLSEDLSNYVIFEQRKPANTHYFDDILQAIKKNLVLHITHYKFDTATRNELKVEPYGLKEYKNRWYLLAIHNNKVRTYGLDRIEALHRTADKFIPNSEFHFQQMFDNVVGIFSQESDAIQEIQLRVYAPLVPYFHTLPLHHSQVMVHTTTNYSDFKFDLKISPDLLTEIKSFGHQVEVLKPAHLRKKIIEDLQKNLTIYLPSNT